MSAPDFPTLYDFETPFEAALKAILEAAFAAVSPTPIVCQVTTQASAPIKDTPRVEIQFQPGNALSQRTAIGQASPKIVPNAFNGRFLITIYATRTIQSGNNANLPTIRGIVRYALSAGAKVFTGSNLAYWQILEMLPEASTPVIFDAKEQAGTELSYGLQFAINNSAWPSSA